MTHYTDDWKEVSSSVISQMVSDEQIRFNNSSLRRPDTFRGYPVLNGIYTNNRTRNKVNAKLIGYSCSVELSGSGTRNDPVLHDFKYFMDPEFVVKTILLGVDP